MERIEYVEWEMIDWVLKNVDEIGFDGDLFVDKDGQRGIISRIWLSILLSSDHKYISLDEYMEQVKHTADTYCKMYEILLRAKEYALKKEVIEE